MTNFSDRDRRLINTSTFVLVAGLTALGANTCIKNIGEEVYNGRVSVGDKQYDVIYKEGRYSWYSENTLENEMTLESGDNIFYLHDLTNEDSIFSPDGWKPQGLEKITIETPEGRKKYTKPVQESDSNQSEQEILDNEHVKNVFDEFDNVYNNILTEIKNKLITKKELEHKAVNDLIPKGPISLEGEQ